MPNITIKNSTTQIEAMMLRSLLFTLQINNIKIATQCGGAALCGKCAVKIVRGEKYLSPKGKRELDKLREMGAASNVRLACQSHPGKDIEIELIDQISD